MNADLIVVNGKVITVNPEDTVVEAFAVKNGKILDLGTSEKIEELATAETSRIDLQGRTATPGLIDTHVHVVSLGSMGGAGSLGFLGTGKTLDITNAKSIRDIVAMVAAKVREREKGEWIVTGGRPKEELGEQRRLTRWDLDPVSPENPVFIGGYPHVVVNSYLLNKAGITKETESPPGGEVVKDPRTGEPTGALAFQAVYQLLPMPPQPSVEETEDAIKKVQLDFLAEGLTAYKDAGLRNNAIKAYQKLRMRGELLCRTQMMYTWLWTLEDAIGAADRFLPYGDDMLMLRSVKLSLDGGILSRTAWSYDDWYRKFTEKAVGSKGYWKIDPNELENMVAVLHDAGLQVCCHCCGDRAIDTYLNAIENALERKPRQDSRHTIIHCNLPTDEAIGRMRRLGSNIAIETQAPWLSDHKFAASCGPVSKGFLPFKKWLQNKIIVGNGCDFPPMPYPPRLGLGSLCTREPEEATYGRFPYGTEESLTIQEALYTYTMGGAKCFFWEDKIGSLEPGKYADFVVWDKDMYTVPVKEIKNLKVLLTAVNGEVLYDGF